MSTDKKLSDLPVATNITSSATSILVDNGVDYQYTFVLLLQFLEANISTGARLSFGATLPQNTAGSDGDVFINTAAGSFLQKTAGTWLVVYTLPAASAADGTMLYGPGLPNPSTGKDGDSYINTLTGIFYQKSGGTWAQIFSMATGPQGPQGTPGTNGTNGTNGNTVLYGTTNPANNSTGVDGNFYINTSSYTLFGPRAAGIWPAGLSLLGADGAPGEAGTAGPQGPQGVAGPAGPAGANGTNGAGVVSGGTAGQVLSKIDSTDYSTQWITPASTGGSAAASAAGASGQIQVNNGGAFGASPHLTLDPSSYQLYLKGKDYASMVIDAPTCSTIQLNNNGILYGYIGSGQTSGYGLTDLGFNAVGAITFTPGAAGNVFYGQTTFKGDVTFGKTDSYLKNQFFGSGTNACIDQVFEYGNNNQSMIMGNSGGILNDSQNFNDWLFLSSGNLGIGDNTAFQAGVYAMFMKTSKSFILQAGGNFIDIGCAILQANSTTKGALLPRMTGAQRDDILSPVAGLEIYNLTTNKKNLFTGSTWETITSS